MSASLGEILFEAAASHASSTCLRLQNAEVWRYSEVQAQALQLTAELKARGALPGDRVLAQVQKSPHAVCLYLACIYAGLVYVPLNPACTRAELVHFIADAKPRLLIRDSSGAARASVEALVLNDLIRASKDRAPLAAPVALDSDAPAAILYTSGTTGRAKGALLSHANLIANARALRKVWHWRSEDVLMHALPIYHAHGLFVALHAALFGGSEIRFLPKFDARQVLSMLPGCTVLMGVPTHYSRLLDAPEFDASCFQGLRLMISGSAPMSRQLHDRVRERTGKFVVERYGLTEGLILTSCAIDAPQQRGTVGRPLPGVRLRVVGAEVGEIEAKGPSVFLGYFGNAQATADAMTDDGYIRTGDLGRIDAEGCLSITGRAKDLIISGGANVHPKEIECEIDLLAGVSESAVVGAPHADFGEAVVAVVVAERPLTLASLRDELARKLARYKLPKALVHVDALPRNHMGKVQKNVLRDRHKAIFEQDG